MQCFVAVHAVPASCRTRRHLDHRPPPPPAAKRVKTWQDIEAMQAQTFSLKPQKDSNVKKISVEQSAMDDFVG